MKHLLTSISIAAMSLVVGCTRSPEVIGTSPALWHQATSGYIDGIATGEADASAMSDAADTPSRRMTSSDLQAANDALVAARGGNWSEMNSAITAIHDADIRKATVDSLSDSGFPVSEALAMKGSQR